MTYQALAAYARLSKNPDGSLTSVEDQIETSERHAATNSNVITAWFSDDDLSAWDEEIERPGWEQYLKALDSGQHDGAMSYHFDRLSRNGTDSERLLKVTKRRNLPLITPQQVLDLGSNADARMIFRVMSAVAINQSDSTSRRVRDHKDSARRRGNLRYVLGGKPPLGFTDGEDDWEADPAGTARLRDVADRVLGGEPLRSALAAQPADWQASVTEKQVRAALRRPATAGLMTSRDGEIMGQVIADPPLDLLTWERLRDLFDSRMRPGRVTGDTENDYSFGPVLACGKCGNQLTGSVYYNHRREAIPVYRCATPHKSTGHLKPCRGVSIKAADVHDVLRDALMAVAAVSPWLAAASGRQADLSAEHAQLSARLGVLKDRMADLIDTRDADLITPDRYRQSKARLDHDITTTQASLSAVAKAEASPLPAVIDWDAMTPVERRLIIGEVFETPIVIQPGTGGPKAPPAETRMVLIPRQV